MTRGQRLTKQEWRTIKLMLGAGSGDGDILDATKRSINTIRRVRASRSFNHYRANVRAYNQQYEGKQSVTDSIETERRISTLEDDMKIVKEILESKADKNTKKKYFYFF